MLACRACEDEIVRAPIGDQAVAGGKLGLERVATSR